MVGHVAQSELTAGLRFELATAADDAEIRRLLRENPMPGRISVSLEREPDARVAAAVEGDEHHTIVAREHDGGPLIAMGSVSVRDAYLNGEPTRVGYLGQLRLDRRHRPRPKILLAGYRFFHELHDSLGVKLYLTSIAEDNARARRFLERGLPGMPIYRPLDSFVTTVLEWRARPENAPRGTQIERGHLNHLPQILACLARSGRRYQFAPVWRQTDLVKRMTADEIEFLVAKRHSRVVGCMAVWDQSAYKQAVIRGYDRKLLRWRRWINVAAGVMKVPRLPPVGTKLNMACLSHVAVDDDDPRVFAALLSSACAAGDRWRDDRGHGHLVLGLGERHPLLRGIPRASCAHAYRTRLYAVHWPDSWLAAEALDARPCQPEVALL
jgi:hypothetical protein